MSQSTRRKVILVLLSVIISFVTLEAALFFIDPWGIQRYYGSGRIIGRHYVWENGRHILRDGTYDFMGWSATMKDGYRYTPDTIQGTAEAACTIVAIGDSATFSFGVNDADTWVNLLAQRFPEVRFLNAGISGYNSTDVRKTMLESDADAFIYLLISNDDGPAFNIPVEKRGTYIPVYYPLLMVEYLSFYTIQDSRKQQERDPLFDWFVDDMDFFAAQDDLIIFGFEEPLAQWVAERYPLILLPQYQSSVSYADAHPSPDGHQEIADAMMPYLKEWILDICTDGEAF